MLLDVLTRQKRLRAQSYETCCTPSGSSLCKANPNAKHQQRISVGVVGRNEKSLTVESTLGRIRFGTKICGMVGRTYESKLALRYHRSSRHSFQKTNWTRRYAYQYRTKGVNSTPGIIVYSHLFTLSHRLLRLQMSSLALTVSSLALTVDTCLFLVDGPILAGNFPRWSTLMGCSLHLVNLYSSFICTPFLMLLCSAKLCRCGGTRYLRWAAALSVSRALQYLFPLFPHRLRPHPINQALHSFTPIATPPLTAATPVRKSTRSFSLSMLSETSMSGS